MDLTVECLLPTSNVHVQGLKYLASIMITNYIQLSSNPAIVFCMNYRNLSDGMLGSP